MKFSHLAILAATLSVPFSLTSCLSQASESPEKVLILGDTAAGDANINLFDKSRLEVEYLSVLKERDQRTYEYLFSALETLHGSFRDLQIALKTLQTLADTSLTDTVPVQDYLAAVRDYRQTRELLEDHIHRLALPPAIREDAHPELSGDIRFETLQEHYLTQLSQQGRKAAEMQFRLALPSGSHHLHTGVNTDDLGKMQLLSAAKINELQRQILVKKLMTSRERTTIDQSINAFTQKALQAYIDAFGASERYRTSSDQQGRIKAAKALRDVFWARAYIRSVYGVKIGSIPVNYQKHIFNADYFLSNVHVGAMSLWDENHLVEALNLATEAQATLHDKGAGSKTAFLRHLLVWVSGSKADDQAKHFIVDLVKADLEQELELSRSGGLRAVRAGYRERYYTSEESKTFYQNLAQTVFGDPDDDDLEADVGVLSTGTLKSAIAQCSNVLEQMEVRLDEARKLQDTLALLTESSQSMNKRKKRADI